MATSRSRILILIDARSYPDCRATFFVFRSKRSDRLKMLCWDGSGIVLLTKWLEEGSFRWPPVQGGVVVLSGAQYAALVSGLDWTKLALQLRS